MVNNNVLCARFQLKLLPRRSINASKDLSLNQLIFQNVITRYLPKTRKTVNFERGTFLYSNFLTRTEKSIETMSLFKIKIKNTKLTIGALKSSIKIGSSVLILKSFSAVFLFDKVYMVFWDSLHNKYC